MLHLSAIILSTVIGQTDPLVFNLPIQVESLIEKLEKILEH